MKRLLRYISEQVIARPLAVVLLAVGMSLTLSLPAVNVPVNLSFMSLMNDSLPLVSRYFALNERLGFSSRLSVLLEGPDEALLPAARHLAEVFAERPDLVDSVQVEPPRDWLQAQAPYLVEGELFDAWLRVAAGAATSSDSELLKQGFSELDTESPFARSGVRLVMLELMRDPLSEDMASISAGTTLFRQVEAIIEDAAEEYGVIAHLGGVPAVATQDQEGTFRAITRLTPLSLLVVLLLLLMVEPHPVRLFLIAVPMLLSVGIALGAVSLVFGQVTIGEAFFGMFVFGLGVDYALHLVVRLREERALGRELRVALQNTLVGAGRGIAAGAVTTVGAFLVIACFPDPMARHLGLSAGVGLLSCMALMLTLLPAVWLLLEQRGARRSVGQLEVPGLRSLCRISVHRPRWVVAVAVVLVVLSLIGAQRFRMESDLSLIFNRDVPAVAVGERIQELFDLNVSPWAVTSPTLHEAQRLHRAFESDPIFVRVEGAAGLLREDAAERQLRLQAARPEIARTARQLADLSLLMPAAAPPRLRQSLEVLLQAAERGPPGPADLPPELKSLAMAPDGEFITLAYTHFKGLDAEIFRRQRLRAEQVDPKVVGFGGVAETAVNVPWGRDVMLAVMALVLLVVALDQRSWRWMLLALLPVSFGSSVTFGLMCWLDVGFSSMLLLVVPLLVGLGVDDGIHVVHRLREDRDLAPDQATCSVGRAIVMTTATTCASFSVLLFSNHPGMESMAMCLILGLPLCLLASVTLIPAVAVLLGLRSAQS